MRLGTLAGVSLLALSGSMAFPGEALARKKQQESGFFDIFGGPAPATRPYRVYNKKPRPSDGAATGKSAEKNAPPAERPVKGPLVLTVSLGAQRVTVHDIDGPIAEAPISSGTAAFPTLQGVFTILEKSVVHHSNLYAGAPMPNMQRLTWSGTALHAGHLPGYPASHGCIRLPYNFSKKLYGLTKLGTRVVVTRDVIVPMPIEHANLVDPLPPEGPAAAGASAEESPVRSYETVRSLSLISTAAADPLKTGSISTDAPPIESLTGYRLKRAQEKLATEEALKAAEAAKIEAEATAKSAVVAADEAKAAAKAARAEAQRLAADAAKAEQARVEGDRAIEAFARKYASLKSLSAEEAAKAAATEQQLEDRTIELGNGLDAARAAAATAKAAVDEADAKVLAAVAKVKDDAGRLAKINQDIKTAMATLESFRKQELVRKHPVSVFISRSLGRLFVRQGYVPIFDVPVEIKDPTIAIGTHVYTALMLDGPTKMRWSATSIPYTPAPAGDPKKKRKNVSYDVAPEGTHLPQTATAALERIVIPADARERIADVMKPGSSIVISDYGMSHQTGQFTDFIVLTR
jgi:lipoprotein-anchoring transpeptidase ErfK/SrfK